MIFNNLKTKERILKEFLLLVPKNGWSLDTLKLACERCDLSSSHLFLIFEDKMNEFEEFFIESQIVQTLEREAEKSEKFLSLNKLNEKVVHLLISGFESQRHNRQALIALANSASLQVAKFSLKNFRLKLDCRILKMTYKIADSIWKLTNDRSTDFNFYSKRLILSKVILRSFATFISDESEELKEVKRVISSEISAILRFSRSKKIFVENARSGLENLTSYLDLNACKSDSVLKKIKSLPFLRLLPSIHKF